MAAVSYSLSRGQDGFKISDWTHGTLAPNANDIELRVNTTDGQGAAMHPMDIIRFLDAAKRAVLSEIIFGADWGV